MGNSSVAAVVAALLAVVTTALWCAAEFDGISDA
jgi:hypothetical protein